MERATLSVSVLEVTDPAALASSRDAASFEELYAAQFPFVWRCLAALGVPQPGLDDAAQDVFVVVHRRLSTFEGNSTLRTWLFGIVRNVASNHRRSAARKQNLAARSEHLAATDSAPDYWVQDLEAADFVRKFLAGLDERKREVFVLAVLEEMSVPEVAEALAIPLNTAYTRLRRAREAFRSALTERKDSRNGP